ncbi:MAG: TfoX/Sxy family protein [Pseudomonadota bacterium]
MAVSKDYLTFITDCFEGVGPVRTRAMFGGAGVYAEDVMFALIADEELYLKADSTTETDFEAEGCGPFVYEGKSKATRMSYWRVSERLFDDVDELHDWARKAIAVAKASKARPRPRSTPRETKRTEAAPEPASNRIDRSPRLAANGKVVVLNANHPGHEEHADAAKYYEMRRALMDTLPTIGPGLTHKQIVAEVKTVLDDDLFPAGKASGWWSKTVQLDLEARGLLKRSKTKPLSWYKTDDAES